MKKLQQLEGTIEKFEAIKEELSVEQGQLDNTLAGLKQELPRLLLGQTLGEVTVNEVGKVKQEMVKLQERLTDIPRILEAIKEEQEAIKVELGNIRKQQDMANGERKYAELISLIKDSTLEYDSKLDSEIRSISNSIGRAAEADEIIGNWKNRLASTPVENL